MKLNAYVLAADPAWIEASVMSYYDLVSRIVVSYDENSCGWTGAPIRVEECLRRLRAIDRDSKCVYNPGHYARLDCHPMENETYQRQCALDEASDGADWVLQLDTDEVLASPKSFISCLERSAVGGCVGMEYPARWLYCHVGGNIYLEQCRRLWGIAAGYPGPVAVQAGIQLCHARQCKGQLYRVDFRPANTDPSHSKDAPVDAVVRPEEGILHYSMVRTTAQLQEKFASWGHAKDRDWTPETIRWHSASRHPILATLATPFIRRRTGRRMLRPAWIKPPNAYFLAEMTGRRIG